MYKSSCHMVALASNDRPIETWLSSASFTGTDRWHTPRRGLKNKSPATSQQSSPQGQLSGRQVYAASRSQGPPGEGWCREDRQGPALHRNHQRLLGRTSSSSHTAYASPHDTSLSCREVPDPSLVPMLLLLQSVLRPSDKLRFPGFPHPFKSTSANSAMPFGGVAESSLIVGTIVTSCEACNRGVNTNKQIESNQTA